MSNDSLSGDVMRLCQSAASAATALKLSSAEQRSETLLKMADALEGAHEEVVAANSVDCEQAEATGINGPILARLRIDNKVFATMLRRLRSAAKMPDPVGRELADFINDEGLRVRKVTTPLGVVAMIYESRPNVTTDCAAACLRSGNAVILRGGSESVGSNRIIVRALRSAITEIPVDAVQLFDFPGHEAVEELLRMNKYIDLLVPRGGKDLIEAVESNSRIPVMRHYDGICHQYIAADADEKSAVEIVINSKCQRYEVCNSLETLLIDRGCSTRMVPVLCESLAAAGVRIRGCTVTRELYPSAEVAAEEDWSTEYLDAVIAIKVVDGVGAAARHIAAYGSGHTDGIITASAKLAQEFVDRVDSASVMVNASTRLSGGEAYNMGAVVGISTGKLHARGPVGPNELTSYKWVAWGNGHLRK